LTDRVKILVLKRGIVLISRPIINSSLWNLTMKHHVSLAWPQNWGPVYSLILAWNRNRWVV